MNARRALALLLLLPTALTACGSEGAPADHVPALATQLEAVEDAVEDGDHDGVRAALERLVARTARAELAGEISAEDADRIRAAAREVLAALPADG